MRSGLHRIAWAIIVALFWPALVHADDSEQELIDRFVAKAYQSERAILARLSSGGVWLGDDALDAVSAVAPFLAVSAQLDFWVQPQYSLHVLTSFAQLIGPAEYTGIPCPRLSAPPDCTADAQRVAIWSSLALGSTWSYESDRRLVNARSSFGIQIRRYSHGRIADRPSETDSMFPTPSTRGSFRDTDWHVSPVAHFAAGVGYRFHPMWIGGLEAEIQFSAPIGAPTYMATGLNLVLYRHWDP